MPQYRTHQQIDSLPYCALQAEAEKYSIRRNLGRHKLSQALKELCGKNPDSTKIPPEWFQPEHPEASRPASLTKTRTQTKSARAPKLHHPHPMPQDCQSTTDAPTPQPFSGSSITHVQAKSNPPSKLIHQKTLAGSKPTTIKVHHLAINPPSLPHPTSNIPTQKSSSIPKTVIKQSSKCSSNQIFPRAIHDEAERLGLTCDELNVQFLTNLVRSTLEEFHRNCQINQNKQNLVQTINSPLLEEHSSTSSFHQITQVQVESREKRANSIEQQESDDNSGGAKKKKKLDNNPIDYTPVSNIHTSSTSSTENPTQIQTSIQTNRQANSSNSPDLFDVTPLVLDLIKHS